jgi:hypothetical protein
MAVFDANCLFSKHPRHLLLGFSVHGIVIGRWSRALLAEAAGSLAKQLRGDSLADLGSWLKHEADLVRDGLVDDYQRWFDQIQLPDASDVHVVAAAIQCGATIIVTENVKDFPPECLAQFGLEAERSDALAVRCINANPVLATRVVTDHPNPVRFLERLRLSLPEAAGLLTDLLD